MYIANIGTYLPKQCGIATFSHDTYESLVVNGASASIIAISDILHEYHYPEEVIFNIRQPRRKDYLQAADVINQSADAVILQHEYGIFGGKDGRMILDLVKNLKKPYLLISHTVPPHPSKSQRTVLTQLVQNAGAVVAMSHGSVLLLTMLYGALPEQVHLIPHGVPVFEPQNPESLKQTMGYVGRDIISTFGLIGPGKGLEIGLKALQQVKDAHPEVLYLILGETHPMLIKREGERYREMLIQLVKEYELTENVQFINQFLTVEEIGRYLSVTDIYFSPYPYLGQAVSGTMAFAIGSGRAIVSTPYAYAREHLSQGNGLLSERVDANELASLLLSLLKNPRQKHEMQSRAKALGENWQWPQVGKQYVSLCHKLLPCGKEYYFYA